LTIIWPFSAQVFDPSHSVYSCFMLRESSFKNLLHLSAVVLSGWRSADWRIFKKVELYTS